MDLQILQGDDDADPEQQLLLQSLPPDHIRRYAVGTGQKNQFFCEGEFQAVE
ncbi:MAG: hypothetical protein IT544_06960 [Rhodobacteraceae bacterium]|nr:hypothetical protein [Paracoccaceae bacterium]